LRNGKRSFWGGESGDQKKKGLASISLWQARTRESKKREKKEIPINASVKRSTTIEIKQEK